MNIMTKIDFIESENYFFTMMSKLFFSTAFLEQQITACGSIKQSPLPTFIEPSLDHLHGCDKVLKLMDKVVTEICGGNL